ncbi:MAG: phage shock protein operon transcriptional activator [Deltaproteobacteria bacterium]|nr:phage shock protein operon transcriptional activator [Deltaproteobacteria bacterium]
MERVNSAYPAEIPEALGESGAFIRFCERLSRVAPIDRPVLIIGERGTGKELAASRLHFLSKRWQGPLVALNCAALTSSLIEAELFGYEKGAFTGAVERRPGRFESADKGTLFLDEIGGIPMEVQEKILRVVEYGSFERVGSSKPVEVNTRIVAATHADLPSMAEEGRFKKDLLDRLTFEVLFLPPLRERGGDIMLLARHFAAKMAFELGRTEVPCFTNEAAAALESHPWPGNVRELKNVVERAVYRSDAPTVGEIVFNPFKNFDKPIANGFEEADTLTADGRKKSFKEVVEELEIRLLRKSLVKAKFNQQKAAKALGLTYHQLRGMLRKYKNKGIFE